MGTLPTSANQPPLDNKLSYSTHGAESIILYTVQFLQCCLCSSACCACCLSATRQEHRTARHAASLTLVHCLVNPATSNTRAALITCRHAIVVLAEMLSFSCQPLEPIQPTSQHRDHKSRARSCMLLLHRIAGAFSSSSLPTNTRQLLTPDKQSTAMHSIHLLHCRCGIKPAYQLTQQQSPTVA
jgi:hypothetical protein